MLDKVKVHYEEVKKKHGDTHLGVGWKTPDDQHNRLQALKQLLKMPCSVNDWGCGYGEFRKYITTQCHYTGYDIVPQDFNGFVCHHTPTRKAHYTVSSGMFNVKSGNETAWKDYIFDCIRIMNEVSLIGFGFNLLSRYCDRKNDALFYGDPIEFFERCRSYGLVTLNHSYSPYDFTILVKKG